MDLQLLQRDEGPQGEASSEQRSKTAAAQLDAYRTEKAERIRSLAAYLDQNSLRNANPTGTVSLTAIPAARADNLLCNSKIASWFDEVETQATALCCQYDQV